ncbi:uncharacterized protein V3H82_019158 [Fundulus diaphanus]
MFRSSIATRLATGHWKVIRNTDPPGQANSNDCGVFMVMYALYMALGWRFDFSQDDMPWLRRWWCHSMLANMTLAANANDTALACNVLLAEEPASKIQRMGDIHPEESLEQSTMTRINEAVCWIRDNMSLFRGHVELPNILSMTAVDRQQFFQNIANDDDIHDSRECLLFVFEYQEDYTVFFYSCPAVSAMFNTPTLSP